MEKTRDTRESVEQDYRYLAFDFLVDMALEGTISMDEAIADYKSDMGI